ncbi:MAG TPA: GAF domain-containing protein [Bryobacteraceae bacterium]|jgi:signal transduction histidine kinase|nr:GAF domain-containing protein [Bryobacteraceae bacterium]
MHAIGQKRIEAAESKRFIRVHSRSFAALFCFAAALSAQTRLTLQQAGSRMAPDWTPVYDGTEVLVSGQVSAPPVWISESLYLAVQDQAGYGLMLEGSERQFRDFAPGDFVESQGTISRHAGLAVLIPRTLRRTGRGAPPRAKIVRLADLASFRYLGVLISTESAVAQEKDSAAGDPISIGERGSYMDVVLPRTSRDSGSQPYAFHAGDRIRVTGIDSQFCRLPPYDRFFQIVVPGPASIAVVEKAWMIPPPLLLASVMLAAALLAIWWFRERRMAALRRRMRVLNSLGEDVIGAGSPAEILRRLEMTLPKVTASSGTGMYLLNRGTKSLESVHATGAAMQSIELNNPRSGMPAGIAACFRNRTLIAIPDTRRSPFFPKEGGTGGPRSAIFVPMFAQSELVGVLELHNDERNRYYSQADQAAMQHLANQVATALKLQEQHSVREQLFRSEKLAAAGQLISEVANELRLPLESIVARASALRSHRMDDFREELEVIAADAQRASQIIARLDSLAKVEQTEVQAVDLTALLTGLLQFREPECKAKGVEMRSQLAAKPTIIMGCPGQLEQVLLNLLVDAEKAAAEAREKLITVSSSLLARRMLVEVAYSTRSNEFQQLDAADADHLGGGALALGACRGIIQSHGGEFRSVRVSPVQARFDIELQVLETRSSGPAAGAALGGRSRHLNVLVVDPDAKVQRQLLQLLGERGDRVVPVSNAEEGVDLVQRMRFDMALCAVRQPGLNWVEFFERVRYKVGSFVLLTDGFDTDLARAFQGSEGFVLSKPIDEAELAKICLAVEERAGLGARG